MAATPASMLRIVTQGLQDRERLNTTTGNPSVHFYSSVLKQRTRWASRWRRVDFDHAADFGKTATVTIPQLGELISRATLIVELPDIVTPQTDAATLGAVGPHWAWTNSIGHAIASTITMTINGQVIDRIDSRLMEVIDEQMTPVEHFDSTNSMIGRNPVNYTDMDTINQNLTNPTLEIIPPFWWNRGPGPQALPIQALSKDQVQLTVAFRPIQQCVFTSSASPIPTFSGSALLDNSGNTVATLPTSWNLNAYWIIEYVSLEDREAAAFRQADLEIPIEQHMAVPVYDTEGRSRVRIPLHEGGLIRDITWVCQRPEAPADYNAYFLFSRDLGDPLWWPDAQIPNWDYGDGYIRPGFSDRRSDPITSATMFISGRRRFEHEGTSFFRSLIPALGSRRTPLINRYIYRYDFGFWPTGGLAEALYLPVDEVRGFANWDKLPDKELVLTMNTESCSPASWSPTGSPPLTFDGDRWDFLLSTANINERIDGFRVRLSGASANGGGRGAFVEGIVDLQTLRGLPGFTNIIVRTCQGGSASLAIQFSDGLGGYRYVWIAVAGSSGAADRTMKDISNGIPLFIGGDAGDAVSIGRQGNAGPQTHQDASGLYDVLYSNTQTGTRISYGFFSPTFRVACGGRITGWEILTEIYPTSLANYIFLPTTSYQAAFVGPPSPNPIQWHTVPMNTPPFVDVSAGTDVFIYHTSLETVRLYESAVDANNAAVCRIPVYDSQVTFGGGGGGRGSTEGPGLPDGGAMTTTESFVLSAQQVGGSDRAQRGGDGYYGGGSGCGAGGGGGSYVSRYISQVHSDLSDPDTDSQIVITPLKYNRPVNPSMNVHIWLTRINMLRVTGGHGALMFTS
jgi:hypothetical protein